MVVSSQVLDVQSSLLLLMKLKKQNFFADLSIGLKKKLMYISIEFIHV